LESVRDMDEEVWRGIVGWEGRYEVSNLGRVRSLPRVSKAGNRVGGTDYRNLPGKTLNPSKIPGGYLMVTLASPGKRKACVYVHDLVCAAFKGPKPPNLEVCHRDGSRDRNHETNLRYGTRSSNALDRHEHGTMNPRRGEQSPVAKLTDDDVRWIRLNHSAYSRRFLATVFGVHHSTISSVINRSVWRHVT